MVMPSLSRGSGRGREFEEPIQQELHAEVVRRAAEEDGREFAGEHLVHIEVRARAFEQFQFVADLLVGPLLHRFLARSRPRCR